MKKRLDVLVTERGLAESRERAKTLIMTGQVYVDNQKADKPGDTFAEEAQIEVRGKGLRYVSRGGLKLEKAMKEFDLELTGTVCMDIGNTRSSVLPTACFRMSGKGIRGGCGLRPVGLEPAERSTGCEFRAHQCPLSHKGTDSPGDRLFLGGCLLYLSDHHSAGCAPPPFSPWQGRVPDQASV